MAKKKKNKAFIYFLASALLLAGAALMKSFPVFVFAGLAPLFAITDHIKEDDSLWTYLDLMLLSISFALFSLVFFTMPELPWIIGQSILFTACFALFIFARRQLGQRLPKFVILIFWLGMEYVFIKVAPLHDFIFLADFLMLKPNWFTWSQHTGYLGASSWILICNLMLYQAVLKKEFNWIYFTMFFLMLITPIGISYFKEFGPVLRSDMLSLYTNTSLNASSPYPYASRGEFIPRTAAWIGTLILIFAFVKSITGKKR